jgi:hypothetical protein
MQNYLYYNNLNLSLYYRILNKTPQNKSLIVIENSIIINDWGGDLGEGVVYTFFVFKQILLKIKTTTLRGGLFNV